MGGVDRSMIYGGSSVCDINAGANGGDQAYVSMFGCLFTNSSLCLGKMQSLLVLLP